MSKNDTIGNLSEMTEIYNDPPLISQSDLPNGLNYFTSTEGTMIWLLLLFGILFFAGLVYLTVKKIIDQDKFTILSVIIVVIVASLFIVVAGFSSERITPFITLLGTIVGYVLGNKK